MKIFLSVVFVQFLNAFFSLYLCDNSFPGWVYPLFVVSLVICFLACLNLCYMWSYCMSFYFTFPYLLYSDQYYDNLFVLWFLLPVVVFLQWFLPSVDLFDFHFLFSLFQNYQLLIPHFSLALFKISIFLASWFPPFIWISCFSFATWISGFSMLLLLELFSLFFLACLYILPL